jgi:prepilin-type N-terminal cleavage/methylation domain-containing protein
LPPVFISAENHETEREEKARTMSQKNGGFTLIEMLVVTAIVGILAALLIPQFITSIQKAKQKGTMQDMNGIAKAIIDYITDVGYAPEQSGAIVAGSTFIDELRPFYVKAMPLLDQWGTAFHVYCGTSLASSGIGGVTAGGPDDFIIISYGRDRQQNAFTFNPLDPETAYFELTAVPSFNQDLILWNGTWIHAPKAGQLGQN